MKLSFVKLLTVSFLMALFYTGCDTHHSPHDNDTMKTEPAQNFQSKRESRTATILLNGPIDTVFTLLEPEPEKKWAYAWNFETVYSKSGNTEEFMIFQTPPAHGSDSKSLWIVTRYDMATKVIQYTITNSIQVTVITIACSKVSANTTSARITYTLTGLTNKGNEIVEMLIHRMYHNNMKDWEEAINYYLANGTCLKHH
jgi:hypothetical protein